MQKSNSAKSAYTYTSLVTVALFGAALLAGATGALAQTTVATVDNVPYTSDGVGDESQANLNAQKGDYNLKLVFAMKTGEYLANVKVNIADRKGTVLDVKSDGPWFFARLPAGTYTVVSTNDGQSESRTVSVGSGLKTVDFRW